MSQLTFKFLVDMSLWRAARYRTNKHHQTAYHKFIEISEPVEDRDDRNALYALYVFDIVGFDA